MEEIISERCPELLYIPPLLEAVYHQRGDDAVEELAEMLQEERPAAESSAVDRAAVAEIDGVSATALSPWH